MLLDENDHITTSLILGLLDSGVSKLSALQVELIDVLYLQRMKAPKQYFKTNYGISGKQIDAELRKAFDALREHYADHGIVSLSDFCAS